MDHDEELLILYGAQEAVADLIDTDRSGDPYFCKKLNGSLECIPYTEILSYLTKKIEEHLAKEDEYDT